MIQLAFQETVQADFASERGTIADKLIVTFNCYYTKLILKSIRRTRNIITTYNTYLKFKIERDLGLANKNKNFLSHNI